MTMTSLLSRNRRYNPFLSKIQYSLVIVLPRKTGGKGDVPTKRAPERVERPGIGDSTESSALRTALQDEAGFETIWL
jgi:hypothetical protein